jgi:hypothetical protein
MRLLKSHRDDAKVTQGGRLGGLALATFLLPLRGAGKANKRLESARAALPVYAHITRRAAQAQR